MSPELDLSKWLTESQVAQQLGISERTLRREVAAQKWQARNRPRPGKKPEIVFDPEAVALRKPGPPTTAVSIGGVPNDMDSMAELTESAVAVIPALLDLIDQRAAAMQPKPEPLWNPLQRASEITGLSEGYLRRMIKADRLPAVVDGQTKVRTASLETADPTDLPPAPLRKRGKRKPKGR